MIKINLIALSLAFLINQAITKKGDFQKIYEDLRSRIDVLGDLEGQFKDSLLKQAASIAGLYFVLNTILSRR